MKTVVRFNADTGKHFHAQRDLLRSGSFPKNHACALTAVHTGSEMHLTP